MGGARGDRHGRGQFETPVFAVANDMAARMVGLEVWKRFGP